MLYTCSGKASSRALVTFDNVHNRLVTNHRELLADDPRFGVPAIIPELCTSRVLTAELIHGLPLDQCHALSQEVKNDVS